MLYEKPRCSGERQSQSSIPGQSFNRVSLALGVLTDRTAVEMVEVAEEQ